MRPKVSLGRGLWLLRHAGSESLDRARESPVRVATGGGKNGRKLSPDFSRRTATGLDRSAALPGRRRLQQSAVLARLDLPQLWIALPHAARRLPRRLGLDPRSRSFAAKVSRQRCKSVLRGFSRRPCFDSARTLMCTCGLAW